MTPAEIQALLDQGVSLLKQTTVGYAGHGTAWQNNTSTKWWQGLDKIARARRALDVPPLPGSVPLLSLFPLPAPAGGTVGTIGQVTYFDRAMVVKNVRILGQAVVRAAGVEFENVLFEGPTGDVGNTQERSGGQDVQVYAMRSAGTVKLTRCEVRRNGWRAGVFSEAPTLILRECHLHDNGGTQAGEENLQHGVYWDEGGGLIDRCLIETSRSFGVQLYPAAAGAVVRHSMIRGNGRSGVIVGTSSRDCLIEDCAITGNGSYGIEAYNLTGPGNRAAGNYVWANAGSAVGGGGGLAVSETVNGPPPASW